MFNEKQLGSLKDFANAVKAFDRFELVADGKAAGAAGAFRRSFIEASGRFCGLMGSEEFAHLSMMHKSPRLWGEIILIKASDPSFKRMRDTYYGMLAQGRTVLLVSDAPREELVSFRLRDGSDVKSVYKPDGEQSGADLASNNLDNLFVLEIAPEQDLDEAFGKELAEILAKELGALDLPEEEGGALKDPDRLRDISFYNKFYFQDSFHAQCMDLDPLTMDQFERSEKSLRMLSKECSSMKKALGKDILLEADHVIFCGCGDSYVAARAAGPFFRHYLPDVSFEAVEGIELSRHYSFEGDLSKTLAVFISYSGTSLRTIEALRKCKKNGVTTLAMTGRKDAPLAEEADFLFFTNNPPGDNNAGLRTYFSNVLSSAMLAALMAERRHGGDEIGALRDAVQSFHDRIFLSSLTAEEGSPLKKDSIIKRMDEASFRAALKLRDCRFFELSGEDDLLYGAEFVQAKIVELSGDPSEACPIEELSFLGSNLKNAKDTAYLVLRDPASESEALKKAAKELNDQGAILELIDIPAAPEGWDFLRGLYSWLPAALLAGFRHTTIGEPMFRGGFDPDIFIPTYFSPIEEL